MAEIMQIRNLKDNEKPVKQQENAKQNWKIIDILKCTSQIIFLIY